MSRYDLTSQPWIPAVGLDGAEADLSLRQIFAQARTLRRISAAPATVEAALVRLLLALVHDAVDGPADEAAWAHMWREGLPIEDIEGYLDRHRDRFDLLHPQTPFLQSPGLSTAKGPAEVERLLPDTGVGRGLFSQRAPVAPWQKRTLGLAEAARYLVHAHHADTSGIKPAAAGDPRAKGGKIYPQGPGWGGRAGHVLVHGHTLERTLLLNLLPGRVEGDRPVWRRPPLAAGPCPEPLVAGPRALYTWPSRRILLAHDGQRVDGVTLSYGDPITATEGAADPMTAWRERSGTEVPARADYGQVPMWRHWPAWTGTAVGGDTRARRPAPVAAHLARQVQAGVLDAHTLLRPQVFRVALGTQESVYEDVDFDEAVLPALALTEAGACAVAEATHVARQVVKELETVALGLVQARGGQEWEGAKRDAAQMGWQEFDGRAGLGQVWLCELVPGTDLEEHLRSWRRMACTRARQIGPVLLARSGPAEWRGRVIKISSQRSASGDYWLNSNAVEVRLMRALSRIESQVSASV